MITATQVPTATPELERSRAAWDDIADGYDRFVTPTADWTLPREALSSVGLRAGMRFLDVASGSGALGIPAARLGADVLAVDISPNMIARLEMRGREEELPNLKARVMDGHHLDLEDESFDVAASQFGVMLFPDLPRALREMVRVTRPGGKVLMVAYGPPTKVEFLQFFMGAMQAVVPGFTGLPEDPPPLPFQVADPDVLHQRMADAGLKNVSVEPGNEPLEFNSGADMWNWVVNSNPIAQMLISDLTAEQKRHIQQVLDGMLRERSLAGPALLSNRVNIAVGSK